MEAISVFSKSEMLSAEVYLLLHYQLFSSQHPNTETD